MKRTELERHLRDHGCLLHHHGGNHDVWLNPANMRKVSVPRHREIKNGTVARSAGDWKYCCLPGSSWRSLAVQSSGNRIDSVCEAMYPETAPDRWGRTIETPWQIGLMACSLLIIQLGLNAVWRRMVL